MAKKKENKKKLKKKKEKKTDWLCLNCNNINYSFREHCNRCGIERQMHFPTIHLKQGQKINGNNTSEIIMNNLNVFQYNINNYNLNKHQNQYPYENNNNLV